MKQFVPVAFLNIIGNWYSKLTVSLRCYMWSKQPTGPSRTE